MFRFGSLFLLDFSCLFLCKGAVFPPSNRTDLVFIPKSTERLEWAFTHDITDFITRTWTFTPSDNRPLVNVARIVGDGDVQLFATSYEFEVEKPATLVLKNVNVTYDGTYQFSLSPGASPSDVVVYIAVKPKVKVCSGPITINEGDNVSCACQGQGGNPPADVTWYKDNRKIGETGKEEKTLTLRNVINEKDHGSYKCVAQSFPNKMFQDAVIVNVIVRPNYKPIKTKIEMPVLAYVGEKFVINCYSEALPAPSFTITHNVTTNIVSNHSRYIKNKVDHSDAGLYKCIAKNVLGNDTDSGNLFVKEKRPSTKSATTQSTQSKTTVRTRDNDGGGSSSGFSPGAIAGICVAVVVLLIAIVIMMHCSYKKKKKSDRDGENIDPPIEGNRYEEPVQGDDAYDTLVPEAPGSKSSSSEKDTPPPVYTAVDKKNRQGNTLYASLDTDAMKPKRESKKERAPEANYASIDFAKTAKAAEDDPV